MKYLDERRTEILREIIYQNLERWNRQGLIEIGSKPQHLWELLGKNDIHDMLFTMTVKDERIIHALAGPNSYTVYKMLKAKQDAVCGPEDQNVS